ncbi:hypothetical protein [Paractinoplanes lichenicola]|uniref:Uncharacterized protein n=1 Tax=Paractinoplanes lichenicola TaxID=2802976 RepID=A0ABS1VFA3_9ACTN|nr:hypothetical protein [Actinoplanes lichenicola]MBL7253374.1 hypothetical protein [Actinoplanes lichenicola]
MSGNLENDPLARAVLRHLADSRGKDDAMGSFARTVLSGEATLREAAANPWHAQGLANGFAAAQRQRDEMTPEQRSAYEEQARRLAEENDR